MDVYSHFSLFDSKGSMVYILYFSFFHLTGVCLGVYLFILGYRVSSFFFIFAAAKYIPLYGCTVIYINIISSLLMNIWVTSGLLLSQTLM